MRRILLVLTLLLTGSAGVRANGLLIPEEKTLPPLAMLDHKVSIKIDDQVAVTRVEQTFRNHTSRELEATYVFPVPRGASVNRFSMWVGGKEVKGELLEAKKARDIYTAIVRRTQDPGLLEYIGNDLLRMRVFPIPAHGDQKVALVYTSVSQRDRGLVEYVYPLKTDGKAIATLKDFSIQATIKSQHGVQNVYSPSHSISLRRNGDREVTVNFDREQGILDRDFQLFYQLGDKDVGMTALLHRPVAGENGYFLLMLTPKVEIKKEYQVPRDVVLVMDTSGSMRGVKMEQAKKALKYCLDNLSSKDRFGLISFATAVNKYRDELVPCDSDRIANAKKWVDDLDAIGGTAIHDALKTALAMRSKDDSRTFTIVFFTDGQPTIGEQNPQVILRDILERNTANTRIFTFGVGDDVNATLLDQLADQTRALASYVREKEDIEAKVSSLYSRMSHPVLANLKLTVSKEDLGLLEIYPPQLPDLFHGQQLTILGRYRGKGPAALKLTGNVGKESKEFVFETTFPERTGEERDFVEHLWARRKVGYLLDQIRANGEKKELVEEVTLLAKKYGITTPYTSYLIVPDGVTPLPVAGGPRGPMPKALAGAGGKPVRLEEFARRQQKKEGELAQNRGKFADKDLAKGDGKNVQEARDRKQALDDALKAIKKRDNNAVQAGKLGVDLSVYSANLRAQNRLEPTALRRAQGRNLMELGGVWIDEEFTEKTPAVVIRAQSNAYFQLLEKQPKLKEVLTLGNHLVWITPSGKALIVDTNDGREELTDAEIARLFASVRK